MAATLRVEVKASMGYYLNPFMLSWPNLVTKWSRDSERWGYRVATAVVVADNLRAVAYLSLAPGESPGLEETRRDLSGTFGVEIVSVTPTSGAPAPQVDITVMQGQRSAGGPIGAALGSAGGAILKTAGTILIILGLVVILKDDVMRGVKEW